MKLGTEPELSVRQAASLFRSGQLSPVELTTWALERIAETEPALHAFVDVFAEPALADARRAEAELRRGDDRGPLHGIPVGVKDIFDVAGVVSAAGLAERATHIPSRDAVVVCMRGAGVFCSATRCERNIIRFSLMADGSWTSRTCSTTERATTNESQSHGHSVW